MSYRRAVWSLLTSILLIPGVASAHEVGAERFTSPIPLPFLLAGAGATVAVTALLLGRRGASPGSEWTRDLGTIPVSVSRPVRILALVLFTAGVIAAITAGLFGPQAAAENFATVFVWGVWFKGLGLVAMLVGSPWLLLSPWRNAHRLVSYLEDEELSLRSYPDRLGVWPAFVGFILVIGFAENLLGFPRRPALTAGLVAAFALVMLLGGLAFGSTWFKRGDAFAVLYRLFGRVAPLNVIRTETEYNVQLRPPWHGCTQTVTQPGLVAFIVATVYTVSFDGFTSTPEYQTLLFAIRDAIGLGPQTPVLLYVVGLLLFVISFLIVAALADIAGSPKEGGPIPAARAFAPTVIPIAAAYEFAHYYPYVARNTGRIFELLAAAVGVHIEITLLGWLTLPVFWGSQVLLIVGGHMIAVVAAHGVAYERYQTLTKARRGHLPLVVLMVGYTVLSLWIVSRPVVS